MLLEKIRFENVFLAQQKIKFLKINTVCDICNNKSYSKIIFVFLDRRILVILDFQSNNFSVILVPRITSSVGSI